MPLYNKLLEVTVSEPIGPRSAKWGTGLKNPQSKIAKAAKEAQNAIRRKIIYKLRDAVDYHAEEKKADKALANVRTEERSKRCMLTVKA